MRRSGVRIPLAPPQADIRSRMSVFVRLGALVWCLLLCCSWRRWCSGRRVAYLDGPGRCVCRWAAARPRDRHTRACGSEWSISRPALALPPPSGALRRPPHRRRLVADVWLGASFRSPARPRHRPPVRPATLMKPSSPLLAFALSPVKPTSSVPHGGVTVWWSARLIWGRSPCDPSRKLSTSDSK